MSRQINLYNPAFVPKRQLLTAQTLAIASAALFGLLLAAGTWTSMRAANARQLAEKAKSDQTLAQQAFDAEKRAADARRPSPELQAEIDRDQTLLSMREEVLLALGKSLGDGDRPGAGFGDYLRGLARQGRDGLWLTAFGVNAGGEHMTLAGGTLDKSLLPDYVRRLNAEPAFAGKAFAGLQVEWQDGPAANEVKSTAVSPAPSSPGSTPPRQSGPQRFLEFRLMAELSREVAR